MTFTYFLEICLYAAINYFPYYALLIHPFTDTLRYSWKRTIVHLMIGYLCEIIIFSIAAMGVPTAFAYILHFVVAFVFCQLTFENTWKKTFLTYLILANFIAIVGLLSKYFENIFFPAYATQAYRWTLSICMIPVEAIFLAFDVLYSVRVYKKTMAQPMQSSIWNFLWTIPGIFILIWYTFGYLNTGGMAAVELNFQNILLMVLIATAAFITDYLISILINEQAEKADLQHSEFIHSIEKTQYDNLNDRIDQARRARHDLRHHLRTISSLVNAQQYDELKEYLKEYNVELPNDQINMYCSHYSVNALLTYYAQQSQQAKINYDVKFALPQDVNISEKDFSIIMGNLLDNALYAAKEVGTELGWIQVRGKYEHNTFTLSIENNVWKQPVPNKDGHYNTTKPNGHGIGVDSVRNAVESYGGQMNIDQENDTFKVTLMMFDA